MKVSALARLALLASAAGILAAGRPDAAHAAAPQAPDDRSEVGVPPAAAPQAPDDRPEVAAPPAAAPQAPDVRPEVVAPPAAAPQAPDDRPEVAPPPFSDGIFPCSACHQDMPANRTRRDLPDMHSDIVLRHDEQHRWCLDCHDADNRDQLHLASGEPVPFEESYRLCGQCHGEKLRDWRAGVHGRRTGDWNGHKRYLLCANCHNPHQPRFRALAPLPAPERPTRPQ